MMKLKMTCNTIVTLCLCDFFVCVCYNIIIHVAMYMSHVKVYYLCNIIVIIMSALSLQKCIDSEVLKRKSD